MMERERERLLDRTPDGLDLLHPLNCLLVFAVGREEETSGGRERG